MSQWIPIYLFIIFASLYIIDSFLNKNEFENRLKRLELDQFKHQSYIEKIISDIIDIKKLGK